VPKALADMHIPPAARRWVTRLVLAIVVAIAIGYLPGEVLREDPRAAKLSAQLAQLEAEAKQLVDDNAALLRDVDALKIDVGAIEDTARADFGMAYPDEVVLKIGDGP
jgi:cell division protein FtsB